MISPLTSSLEVFKQKGNSALSSPFKWLKALDILHLLQQVPVSCHQGGSCSKHPPAMEHSALTAPSARASKQHLHFNSLDVTSLKSELKQDLPPEDYLRFSFTHSILKVIKLMQFHKTFGWVSAFILILVLCLEDHGQNTCTKYSKRME